MARPAFHYVFTTLSYESFHHDYIKVIVLSCFSMIIELIAEDLPVLLHDLIMTIINGDNQEENPIPDSYYFPSLVIL